MERIGIDPGSKESQICVRSASGEVLLELRCRTERLGAFLSGRAPGRVIVETCTEPFRVAAAAQRAGHEVRVVAATLVRSLGVGQRGLKNDVRDARVLSEASCRMELPSVHIPTVIAQEVKAICVSREALIKTAYAVDRPRPRALDTWRVRALRWARLIHPREYWQARPDTTQPVAGSSLPGSVALVESPVTEDSGRIVGGRQGFTKAIISRRTRGIIAAGTQSEPLSAWCECRLLH